ncbi:MAG: chromosome segregation protein SMC, partial [Gammaproteobacteria bacterium CG_4_9_14_3_um_filter_38_9]
MQLKRIQLNGFKSFVDSTSIPVLSQMNAIVGPNGCGKSNIVDAIRWVTGETSAKQLRGQSMSDVIFNGTTERKPLGKASVELTFDNSDRRITGEYAAFSEISVRREVVRDEQSAYFINGVPARRRDLVDLFLGTGLGPRSYAIIEQGMISQLVEAKPEDMRSHLEEVAGISKYRERRRETENRIRHTQDNLDRLNDVRDELEKQLRHLERQS